MLWLGRSPFTLRPKFDATEVGVLFEGNAELTPRPSAANAAKFRFSVASSVTWSPLISVLTTFESACTCSASAVTVTSCVSAPTASWTFEDTVIEMFTTMPVLV